MKNHIMLNGKQIELSEETAKNLADSFEEKEYYAYKNWDRVYWADRQRIESAIAFPETDIKSTHFESKNRNTLERANKWIQLQNFADEVNGEFGEFKFYVHIYKRDVCVTINTVSYTSHVCFSSKENAQKAIDYFGEDFFRELFNVK